MEQRVMERAGILIVEDETLIAMDARITLEAMGRSVAGVATSGSQALEMIESKKPSLVIMDVMLQGGISGIETVRQINKKYQDLPVLYLTAHTDAATLKEINLTKHFGIIGKPFEDYELRDALDRVTESK